MATTTTIRSVCRKCGTIAKYGKSSCCGRGGSWFGNCGSTGNAKSRHTWNEGIHVCKTRPQSNRASGRQSNAAQRLNSKSVMTVSKVFTFTPTNTPIPIPVRTSSIKPVNKSINKSPDGTTEYGTGKAKFKTITMAPTTITYTSANTSMSNTSTTATMLMTAAPHTSTLATTIPTTTIVAMTVIIQTAKEETVTDWVSQGMCYAQNVSEFVMNSHVVLTYTC